MVRSNYETTYLVRTVTDDERTQLEAERRGSNAFRVRRAPIVLASAQGLAPKPIAQLVGCCVQTVRNVIRAFHSHAARVPAQALDAAQERHADFGRHRL